MLGAPDEKPATDAKPPPVANVGTVARGAAAARVTEELQRPKRGRPPGSGSKTSGTGAAAPVPESRLTPELAAQIDGMFKPEAWSPLMSLPADAMLALTGHEWWNINDKERVALGATASCAARFLVIENPKTLAIIMVSAAVLSVYSPRIIKEMASRRKEKEEKDK